MRQLLKLRIGHCSLLHHIHYDLLRVAPKGVAELIELLNHLGIKQAVCSLLTVGLSETAVQNAVAHCHYLR